MDLTDLLGYLPNLGRQNLVDFKWKNREFDLRITGVGRTPAEAQQAFSTLAEGAGQGLVTVQEMANRLGIPFGTPALVGQGTQGQAQDRFRPQPVTRQ